jgi:integrase
VIQHKQKRRGGIKGVTVYQRGNTWSYRVDLEPDLLTGKRQRENRGGFPTEDDAWAEAVKARTALATGRHVKASRRTVRQVAAEWLASIEHSIKPSTYTNYVDYLDAYVLPTIGDRRLQDINVTILNALYRHLLENGRIKPNNNAAMYDYWLTKTRTGRTVTPRQLATECKTSIHAARRAVARYEAGRFPRQLSSGLAPKTVRNIQNMLHKMFGTATAWHYIEHNPTDHVSKPRVRRRRPETWDAEQLRAFLTHASTDRFRALWVLVATTGMRRSELAGAERASLDLDAGQLTIAPTRVVVGGKAVDEDGKTESGRRTISLDPHTVAVLREHVAMLDEERQAWGDSYPDHGKLFCYEDGRQLHPDTITRRFNRLVDRSGLPRITLHGVRHSYATVSVDAGINPKAISERIGHSSVAFTMQTYVQRSGDLVRDAGAAATVANLIMGDPVTRTLAHGGGTSEG